MIQLVGPGGAGKTTVGAALAEALSLPFLDLDSAFAAQNGDVSAYMKTYGYEGYARQNVERYAVLIARANDPSVIALSSGFMTYAEDVHSGYRGWRARIASSESTFVLLPSLDLETCVAETVRRQLRRRFARSRGSEERVIRSRFPIYLGLNARKIETMRPLCAIVGELVAAVSASSLRKAYDSSNVSRTAPAFLPRTRYRLLRTPSSCELTRP